MRECVNVMDEAVNVSSVTSMRFNLIRAVSSNEWLIVLSEMGLWLSCLNAVFLLGDVWGCCCCRNCLLTYRS